MMVIAENGKQECMHMLRARMRV